MRFYLVFVLFLGVFCLSEAVVNECFFLILNLQNDLLRELGVLPGLPGPSLSERLSMCLKRLTLIAKLNSEGKNFGYFLDPNINAILTEEEQQKRMGYRHHQAEFHATREKRNLESELERTYVPPYYEEDDDWQPTHGLTKRHAESVPKSVNINYQYALGPAEDQGFCACCYAYASTAMISKFLYNVARHPEYVSAQELVDCSGRPEYPDLTNDGCKYGHFDECALYFNRNSGINLKKDYPYVGHEQSCSANRDRRVLKGYSAKYVAVHSEYEAYLALKEGYLVATAICASNHLRYYKSGILNGPACECEAKCPNHAVVIVGLGYDDHLRMHYWIVRNSWGTKYGDNGHFRIRAFAKCACLGHDMGYFKFQRK